MFGTEWVKNKVNNKLRRKMKNNLKIQKWRKRIILFFCFWLMSHHWWWFKKVWSYVETSWAFRRLILVIIICFTWTCVYIYVEKKKDLPSVFLEPWYSTIMTPSAKLRMDLSEDSDHVERSRLILTTLFH